MTATAPSTVGSPSLCSSCFIRDPPVRPMLVFLPILQMGRLRHGEAAPGVGSETPGQAVLCPRAASVLKTRPALSPDLEVCLPNMPGVGLACGCSAPPPRGENRVLSVGACMALLVEQEQLLMTFRKKLMMRNASWHFRSARQQPRSSPHGRGREGAGHGGRGAGRELISLCQ